MVRKYIPIPINEKNHFNKENYLDTYIDGSFCKYIFKKGVYEGQLCDIKCHKNNYCKKHFKLLERKTISEDKRMKIQRCTYISKIYNKCNRKCIEGEEYCINHRSCKSKIKKTNNLNLNNNNIHLSNKCDNINLHLNQKMKEKRKKKKLRHKKNKKLRKEILSINNKKYTNIFDYNKILDNKKGLLFKEDNILYTYNLYEQRVIVDCIDGIQCVYCNYIRYTNSGPCIYADCENRKYGNIEFIIYQKINGKELISKYNEKLNKKTRNTITKNIL
jgi:hypothetical protein